MYMLSVEDTDRYSTTIYKKILYYIVFFIMIVLFGFFLIRCGLFENRYNYLGDIDLKKYPYLKEKKIFLDPGHGGKGESDRFRVGPDGITEEDVNLSVALILKNMLTKAGASVSLSRKKDEDVPLKERVDMVREVNPDLLISLHHNGTARRMDEVNYPCVLIWGNKRVRPLSYIFANMLMDEFHKIIDEKGKIISDFAIYKETGTMILRETRNICPGVIGEPGFFSDEKHSKRLSDILYNQLEAEAYFYAIAEFFNRGIPKAEVYISSHIDNDGYLSNLINDNKPRIAIKVFSGIEDTRIKDKSLKVTLDGIPVGYRKISDDLYEINYGKKLYPGGHSIRFSFNNRRSQSSMIYRSCFVTEIKKGDYNRLISKGIRFVKGRKTAREGLKMLLSALSLGVTDPAADRIIWNIAKGFAKIRNWDNSDYYYSKLYNFYPQSRYVKRLQKRFRGYRFPVEYLGKTIAIKHDPELLEYE